MKSREVIASLSALASEARLAAYRLLVKRGPSGYTPTELVERLGVPGPTLSFHLKELVNAGLLESRREGTNLYYSPNIDRMRALMSYLTENCCSLADEACDANCQPLSAITKQKRRA
jgi:DNA-binding transcriptional ArsR family regulator